MKKKNVDALNARIESIAKEIGDELEKSKMLSSNLTKDASLFIAGMRTCVGLIDNKEVKEKSDADIAKGILGAVAFIRLFDDLADEFADKIKGDDDE